jgi:hypothetical protein
VITGARGDIAGIPVITSAVIPDGELLIIGPSGPGTYEYLAVGIGPIDNSEWCRREALRIVQTGLADVLEWLGEPPWRPPLAGLQLLARIKELP